LNLWDAKGRRLIQSFHCWAWPNLIFWSIFPDHAPRQGFPLHPGIAGLAAMVWIAFLNGKLSEKMARFHLGFALIGLAVFGVACAAGGIASFFFLPSATWWLTIAVAGMGFWCVREGFAAWRAKRLGGMFTAIIVTWLVCKVAFVNVYVPMRNQGRAI